MKKKLNTHKLSSSVILLGECPVGVIFNPFSDTIIFEDLVTTRFESLASPKHQIGLPTKKLKGQKCESLGWMVLLLAMFLASH